MGWSGLPRMSRVAAGLIAVLLAAATAQAGGWATVHRYVKPTGACAGQEVLASYYWSGRRTASGEVFDANGNTAAARTWPLGPTLPLTNPHHGPSITGGINDTGPCDTAYRM